MTSLADALARVAQLEVQLRRKDREIRRLKRELKESQCPAQTQRPTKTK